MPDETVRFTPPLGFACRTPYVSAMMPARLNACACHMGSASAADLLAEDNGRRWTVAGDEGVVHQHVIGSYTLYAEALPVVRAVGDQLIAGLSAAASKRARAVAASL